MGIVPEDLSEEQAQQLGLAQAGVVIGNLYVGSPAQRAGLQPGDLLLGIDGSAPAQRSGCARSHRAATPPGSTRAAARAARGQRSRCTREVGERATQRLRGTCMTTLTTRRFASRARSKPGTRRAPGAGYQRARPARHHALRRQHAAAGLSRARARRPLRTMRGCAVLFSRRSLRAAGLAGEQLPPVAGAARCARAARGSARCACAPSCRWARPPPSTSRRLRRAARRGRARRPGASGPRRRRAHRVALLRCRPRARARAPGDRGAAARWHVRR